MTHEIRDGVDGIRGLMRFTRLPATGFGAVFISVEFDYTMEGG
jgi:hypothetical protein